MKKNKFGIQEKSYKMLIDTLKNFLDDIEKVIIFGSRVLGNYKNGSDIDIALKGKNLNFNKILKIRTILNQKILSPYKFDIIHYENIKNKKLKEHIDKYGKEIKIENE